MATKKIFGGPGTGKTTFLIKECVTAETDSQSPSICYLTYSKAMAKEARERSGLPARMKEGQVAGTLHSIYSQLLGYSKEDYLDRSSIHHFFKGHQIELFPGDIEVQDDMVTSTGISLGGKILAEFDAHQQAYRPLMPIDGFEGYMDKLFEEYQKMKGYHKDFTDILIDAKEQKLSPEASHLLVDEFQDLTPLMYDIILEAEKDAERTLIAGDDDQCIYNYRGCDSSLLLRHPGEEQVLPWSYRCTKEILDSGRAILEKEIPNTMRKVKDIGAETGGIVSSVGTLDIAIEEEISREGTCYILARTNRMALKAGEMLQDKGIAYGAVNPRHWNTITPWTKKAVLINNALASYDMAEEPTPEEKKILILSLPAKLMEWGTKTLVQKGDINLEERLLRTFFSRKYTGLHLLSNTNLGPRTQEAIWKRGLNHLGPFKFFVDTKHASKGKEADAVISLQDVPKVIRESPSPNTRYEEARLEYVARTRARERLYLCNLRGWL